MRRFKLTVSRNGVQLDDTEAEEEEDETSAAAVLTVENDLAQESLRDAELEEKAEGLEAGEVAALAKKTKIPPKPIECCITINRYEYVSPALLSFTFLYR